MKILGVKIDNLTIEEAFQKIEGFLEDGQQRYIVTPNPEFLIKAQQDREFRRILNQADLAVADGIGLIFASWFLGQSLKGRITGVDLMEGICQRAVQKKWLIYLFGAVEGVAERTVDNLKEKYPGLQVKVWQSDSQQEISPRPIILFVALGAPKQEKWIVQNLEKMSLVKLAVGVGGTFDFISGQVRRAPKFLQRLGLEWLWRLFYQPWRIKRIFNAVVKFPWLILRERLLDLK